MLLVDDILLSPVRGITWVFKQIHQLAEEELEGEADRIRDSLTELYMMLETGEISEEEFERRETELLDKLDALNEEDDILGNSDDEDQEVEEESPRETAKPVSK